MSCYSIHRRALIHKLPLNSPRTSLIATGIAVSIFGEAGFEQLSLFAARGVELNTTPKRTRQEFWYKLFRIMNESSTFKAKDPFKIVEL